MALPATNTTIRLRADISVYFGGPVTNVSLSALATTYLGRAVNSTVAMSAAFGGR